MMMGFQKNRASGGGGVTWLPPCERHCSLSPMGPHRANKRNFTNDGKCLLAPAGLSYQFGRVRFSEV